MRTATFAAAIVAIMSDAALGCDMMCAAIYSQDEFCNCVPIAWMECHPQYNMGMLNQNCNQEKEDHYRERRPEDNPYKYDNWYKENMAQWQGHHGGHHDGHGDHNEIDDIGDLIDYYMDASVLQLTAKASVFTAAVLSCLF